MTESNTFQEVNELLMSEMTNDEEEAVQEQLMRLQRETLPVRAYVSETARRGIIIL